MRALKHLKKLFMLVIMQMVQVYIEGWELMMLPPKAPTGGQSLHVCYCLNTHPPT